MPIIVYTPYTVPIITHFSKHNEAVVIQICDTIQTHILFVIVVHEQIKNRQSLEAIL